MTLSGTVVKQVTIKSDGDVFHKIFRYRTHHISEMIPGNIKGVDLHDGEWGTVGSIIVWDLFLDGKPKVVKEVIQAIDKEKKSVCFKVIEGDILEAYKTFLITLHVETRGDENVVTWTFHYEKLNENVDDPDSLMELCINGHPLRPSYCNARRNVDYKFQILETSVNEDVCACKYEHKWKRRMNLNYNCLLTSLALWLKSTRVRGILLLNVITLLYASNIPVLKEAETVVDPSAFGALRFTILAIPFLPFTWKAQGDVQALNSGIELGLWASLGYLMQALGLLTSDAGRASFITMFTVIVVPLIDGVLGAVVPTSTWVGALLSIVGVGMLECSGSPPCVGDLLNFLSALFFGIHMLRTEHISRKTNKANFLPVIGYEVLVIALSSIIWYLIGLVIGGSLENNPSSWTWEMFLNWMVEFPWIPALYTGVFSTGLCLWIEMTSMCDVSATETAIVYTLEPVWGAGFAWFFLGERWGVSGWFGAALVLGGSIMVQIIGASSPSSSVKYSKQEYRQQNEASAPPV